MAPTTHTEAHALVFGQEVSFGSIAGPLDFVDVYVDGNAAPNAIVEWRVYATVGSLVSEVAKSLGGGRSASVLKWQSQDGATYSPIAADGSTYELRAYWAQGGPAPTMKASIVGYDQFDTVAASGSSSTQTIPAGFGEVDFATASGYSQFADAAVEQDFEGKVLFTLYALSEGGGVEAPVAQQLLQQADGTTRIFSNEILPGATSYRLAASDPTGAGGQSVKASLAAYSIVPAATPPMPASPSAVIFRPGVASSGLFVETWAEVQTAIAAAEGCIIVYVDDGTAAAHVPGSSGITEGFGRLEIRPYRGDAALASTLTVDDGATIRGIARLSGTIFVTSDCQSATPSFDWDYSANIVGTPFPSVVVDDRASFGATGTATQPAVVIGAGETLVFLFSDNGGIFLPAGLAFFHLDDPTAAIIITSYAGELRDDSAVALVPDTWIDGTGAVQFDYDSPTIYNSVGLPQFSNTGGIHYHNTDTSQVTMTFVADAADVLATLQSTGHIAKTGNLFIQVEGCGGAGGGGGGQGGAAGPGQGGGGGAGATWCNASGLFDLSHTLNIICGVGGTPGAAGAPGGGNGGNGGDGSQSGVRDGTSLVFICDFRPGSGARGGGGGGTAGFGGASSGESQWVDGVAGFSGAGGSGNVGGVAGLDGNTATNNLTTSGPGAGGVGGTSAGGQGGGGGGGGAGPLGPGGGGGNGGAGAGGPGQSGGGLGCGGGGGAGGTGAADPGGPGAPGQAGFIRITFLAQ